MTVGNKYKYGSNVKPKDTTPIEREEFTRTKIDLQKDTWPLKLFVYDAYGATQQGIETTTKFSSVNDFSDKMYQNAGALGLIQSIASGGVLDYSFAISLDKTNDEEIQPLLREGKYLETKPIKADMNQFYAQGANIASWLLSKSQISLVTKHNFDYRNRLYFFSLNEDLMDIELEAGEAIPSNKIIWVTQGFDPIYNSDRSFAYGILTLKKILYYETQDTRGNFIKYEFYKNQPLNSPIDHFTIEFTGPFALNELSLFKSDGTVVTLEHEVQNVRSDGKVPRLYYNEIAPIFQGTELVWNWSYLTNIQNALNTYKYVRPTANMIVYEYGSGTHYMFEPGRLTGVLWMWWMNTNMIDNTCFGGGQITDSWTEGIEPIQSHPRALVDEDTFNGNVRYKVIRYQSTNLLDDQINFDDQMGLLQKIGQNYAYLEQIQSMAKTGTSGVVSFGSIKATTNKTVASVIPDRVRLYSNTERELEVMEKGYSNIREIPKFEQFKTAGWSDIASAAAPWLVWGEKCEEVKDGVCVKTKPDISWTASLINHVFQFTGLQNTLPSNGPIRVYDVQNPEWAKLNYSRYSFDATLRFFTDALSFVNMHDVVFSQLFRKDEKWALTQGYGAIPFYGTKHEHRMNSIMLSGMLDIPVIRFGSYIIPPAGKIGESQTYQVLVPFSDEFLLEQSYINYPALGGQVRYTNHQYTTNNYRRIPGVLISDNQNLMSEHHMFLRPFNDDEKEEIGGSVYKIKFWPVKNKQEMHVPLLLGNLTSLKLGCIGGDTLKFTFYNEFGVPILEKTEPAMNKGNIFRSSRYKIFGVKDVQDVISSGMEIQSIVNTERSDVTAKLRMTMNNSDNLTVVSNVYKVYTTDGTEVTTATTVESIITPNQEYEILVSGLTKDTSYYLEAVSTYLDKDGVETETDMERCYFYTIKILPIITRQEITNTDGTVKATVEIDITNPSEYVFNVDDFTTQIPGEIPSTIIITRTVGANNSTFQTIRYEITFAIESSVNVTYILNSTLPYIDPINGSVVGALSFTQEIPLLGKALIPEFLFISGTTKIPDGIDYINDSSISVTWTQANEGLPPSIDTYGIASIVPAYGDSENSNNLEGMKTFKIQFNQEAVDAINLAHANNANGTTKLRIRSQITTQPEGVITGSVWNEHRIGMKYNNSCSGQSKVQEMWYTTNSMTSNFELKLLALNGNFNWLLDAHLFIEGDPRGNCESVNGGILHWFQSAGSSTASSNIKSDSSAFLRMELITE